MEFRKEKRNNNACGRNAVKKIGILIVVSLLLISTIVPVLAVTTIETPFQEPVPSLHTAYLYIGNNTQGRLFFISSPADLKDIYMFAEFDGTKWKLTTGSLKDGLAADIVVVRYNAVSGERENTYTIDTSIYKTTTIFQASSYTQYISYGVPVSDNGNLSLASVGYTGAYDTELLQIQGYVSGIYSDTGNISLNVELLVAAINTIKTKVTSIDTVTKAISSKVNNIYTYLQNELPNIENYLSLIEDDCTELIQQLKNAVNELKTANYWLEHIYNVINDNNATTIPNENASNIDEYNSLEDALMQDKSIEIESIFNDNAGINPNGISFINNMLQQWALSIPEISSIIIMFLAIGIGVLLMGRKV